MAAFAFWVYVMNEQNPLVENSYTVPVEVRNLDRSLVALNVPQRVKVKIRMNRSDLVSMRSDNIKAYVDLSGKQNANISTNHTHQLFIFYDITVFYIKFNFSFFI